MTVLALPFVCSAALGACSFLGFRPIIMACCLPGIVGGCWMFA